MHDGGYSQKRGGDRQLNRLHEEESRPPMPSSPENRSKQKAARAGLPTAKSRNLAAADKQGRV